MPAKRRAPPPSRSRKSAAAPPAPRSPAKHPPPRDAARKPSLRFNHSADLRRRTNEALAAIEGADDPSRHVAALSAIATELTEAGLTYFFLEPLRAANAGFLIEQSASFGVSSAVRVLSPVVRNVMAWLDKDQVLVVVAHVRRFMH